MKVIRILGFASGALCPHAGQYLETFDFEAFSGQGYGTFTPDPAKAMTFADAEAALTFWNTQSKSQRTRPDGKPNKPLTASHAEIMDSP